MKAYIGRQADLGIVDVPFRAGHAQPHDRTALDLVGKALGMEHRAAVGDACVVEDFKPAGLKIKLDLDETAGDGRHHAFVAKVVLCNPDQSRASDPRHSHACDVVDILRGFFAG